jgi:methionyl-tRNA formyltransferase
MRIVFMGTPDFAKESLEAVYNAGHDIVAVVTNPDRPKGRGMKMIASPVKEFAIEKNIKVYQPEKVKNNKEFIDTIKSLNPDVLCVVAYGKILPKEILDIPKKGAINVHGSLLPKYRGAAPIQWAVLNGDRVTGITTMYMDVGMDTGDIILKKEVEIGNDETTGELWDRLSKLGGKLLVETLNEIDLGTVTKVAQGENFTMAPMLNKQMGKIDWENKSVGEIKNLVRGLNPIMGAYSFLNDKKIKFWKVEKYSFDEIIKKFPDMKEFAERIEKIDNGTVILSDDKKGLFIKAKNGVIEALEVQGENAKKMAIGDFLRGTQINIGEILK